MSSEASEVLLAPGTPAPEFTLLPEIMDLARENARKAHVDFEVMDSFEASKAAAIDSTPQVAQGATK